MIISIMRLAFGVADIFKNSSTGLENNLHEVDKIHFFNITKWHSLICTVYKKAKSMPLEKL